MYKVLTVCLLATSGGTLFARPNVDFRTTHLVCAKTIPLDISHDGRNAVVRNWQGRQVTLARETGFPGVKYTGSGVTVMRTDDVFIFIGSDGQVYDCDMLKR